MNCKLGFACTISCICGNEVAFGPDKVFSYCSNCGRRHNRLRKGESAFSYAGRMAEILKEKLLGKDMTFHYVAKNYSSGAGYVEICAERFTFNNVIGVLDEGASVKMLKWRHVASMYNWHNGGYGNVSASHTQREPVSIEFSEEDVLTLDPEDIFDRLKHETKPLYSKRASKKEYEAIASLIAVSSQQELEELLHDEKTKKVRGQKPVVLPEWIKSYYDDLEKIAEQPYSMFERSAFILTPRRTLARGLKKRMDAPLLVATGPDGSSVVITADEVRRGVAPDPKGFVLMKRDGLTHLVVIRGQA